VIRRISTKLLLAVLAAVVVPFLGFALFVEGQMRGRLSRDIVLSSLKGLAADLSAQIDRDVEQYRSESRQLAASPLCNWAIDERDEALSSGQDTFTFRNLLAETFDSSIEIERDYDCILLVDKSGKLVVASRIDRRGLTVSDATVARLAEQDFSDESWFRDGLAGRTSQLDQHISTLVDVPRASGPPRPEDYHIGFSSPVMSERESGAVAGVVFLLVNWSPIQSEIRQPVLKDYFQGLVGREEFPSAYGWVWKSDADTILAHPRTELYGKRVSEDLDLPEMTEAARSSDWALYPPYEFEGRSKSAAFKHCAPPEQGGFDWVVGVGIDDEDIFKGVKELRGNLYKATGVVLLVAVLFTMVIARRTTEPILALREHTRKVARGDLDARVGVHSTDELGELARSFNEMTAELKASREKIVKAEKDAAWREMARQVAHDIKNPLTPIKLSADLLKRAKDEKSPQFDAIFDRTIDTISRQVAHLREIASDFHALTGAARAHPAVFDAAKLMDEVLELNAAWAEELGVRVTRTGAGGIVNVDPGLLRRALINLVSNAFEAMPHGGTLAVHVGPKDGRLAIAIEDSGAGIPADVRPRLFEPYFTTRSTGTGLGLAIARRVIEEMGGTIGLDAAEPGPGTVARIALPLHVSA
jgi:signal transduction histidine kinase